MADEPTKSCMFSISQLVNHKLLVSIGVDQDKALAILLEDRSCSAALYCDSAGLVAQLAMQTVLHLHLQRLVLVVSPTSQHHFATNCPVHNIVIYRMRYIFICGTKIHTC